MDFGLFSLIILLLDVCHDYINLIDGSINCNPNLGFELEGMHVIEKHSK